MNRFSRIMQPIAFCQIGGAGRARYTLVQQCHDMLRQSTHGLDKRCKMVDQLDHDHQALSGFFQSGIGASQILWRVIARGIFHCQFVNTPGLSLQITYSPLKRSSSMTLSSRFKNTATNGADSPPKNGGVERVRKGYQVKTTAKSLPEARVPQRSAVSNVMKKIS